MAPLVRAPGPPGRRALPVDERLLGGLLALGLFFLVTLGGRSGDLLPSPARLGLALAWPAVTLGYLLTGWTWLVAVALIAGGLLLRWVDFFPGGGSDVLPAISEAIATLLGGGNPYDHYYLSTRPPGMHVPYPPFALFIHAPGYLVGGLAGVRLTELALAAAVMLVFGAIAIRRSPHMALPALAAYAALPNLINLTTDSSMDTGAGAVLLFAALGLAWAERRGFAAGPLVIAGILAAVALGTKQSTLPVVALLAVRVWQGSGRRGLSLYGASIVAVLAIVSVPFLLAGPATYVIGLTRIDRHDLLVYGWNMWVLAQQLGWPIADPAAASAINASASLAAFVLLGWLRYASTASAVVAGVVLTLVVFFTAQWTTYAYFAMLAPLILAVPVLGSLSPPAPGPPGAGGPGATAGGGG